MASYVLSEELRRAVVQVVNQHQSSFQPRPKRGRRPRNSGGGEEASGLSTAFGNVVRAAAPSYGSAGAYADESTIGRCEIMLLGYTPEATGIISGWTYTDMLVEFRSLHKTPIPVGTLVRLYCEVPFTYGNRWPTSEGQWLGDKAAPLRQSNTNPSHRAVWAEIVRSVEELYALPGAGSKKILWLPENASSPSGMRWDGEECPA